MSLEDLYLDKIYPKGTKLFKNDEDKLHRENGPAVIYPDGGEEWHYNGFPHRADGPAVTTADGRLIWYWHGHRATLNAWAEKAGLSEEEAFLLKLKYVGMK